LALVTGSLIKRLRKDAAMTQKQVAKLAGVSQAHIAKIEGKVDPRLSTVNRIIQVLAVGAETRSRDVMTRTVIFARPNESVLKVSEVMVKEAVSQLPVMEGKRVLGTVTEESIIRNLKSNISGEKVRNVTDPPLPTVSEDTNLLTVRQLLERNQAVLVTKGLEVVGIITRSDLLKTLA